MVCPSVPPRIEQPGRLVGLWIHRGEVRSLIPITVAASERQVFGERQAAVLLSPDMVNLVGKEEFFFADQTVLATSLSTLPHLQAESPRNAHGQDRNWCRAWTF